MVDGSKSAEIVLLGERILLLLEKAVFFPERGILILADLHLGKASHFRKNGIYVPPFQELEMLDCLCAQLKPLKLIFLGDLFHSILNEAVDQFRQWSVGLRAEKILIKGNHDILSCELYDSMNITCLPELKLGELLLLHERDESRKEFTIHGHIHPAITILGKGRQGVNLPAFVLNPDSLLLPAFGEFTGNYIISRTGDNIFYVLTPQKIFIVR